MSKAKEQESFLKAFFKQMIEKERENRKGSVKIGISNLMLISEIIETDPG